MEGAGPSGGVFWHLRCLRSRARWRATARAIAEWLASVDPAGRELLLIGPSAGWMLPGAWLQGFDRIEAYDLDPLAGWLFQRNHGARLTARGVHWQFHRHDALAALPELLAAHPHASVLFDNLLGQQRFRGADPLAAERQMAELGSALAGRDWGSVHDLWSGPLQSGAPDPATLVLPAIALPGGAGWDGLDAPATQAALLERVGARGEWLDHLAGGVLPAGTPCRLILWPFAPGYAHWLQAAWLPGQRAATSRQASASGSGRCSR